MDLGIWGTVLIFIGVLYLYKIAEAAINGNLEPLNHTVRVVSAVATKAWELTQRAYDKLKYVLRDKKA